VRLPGASACVCEARTARTKSPALQRANSAWGVLPHAQKNQPRTASTAAAPVDSANMKTNRSRERKEPTQTETSVPPTRTPGRPAPPLRARSHSARARIRRPSSDRSRPHSPRCFTPLTLTDPDTPPPRRTTPFSRSPLPRRVMRHGTNPRHRPYRGLLLYYTKKKAASTFRQDLPHPLQFRRFVFASPFLSGSLRAVRVMKPDSLSAIYGEGPIFDVLDVRKQYKHNNIV